MTAKTWTTGEIRALARRTVEGKNAVITARGAYFRALVETAQAELIGKDQRAQLAAVKAAHNRFYPVVEETIATDEILLKDGIPQKRVAFERNRRLNFARSAYGAIRRWLRAEGHDLMKLDPEKVTKSQMLKEAPPTRKHALTPDRVHRKAGKLVEGLVGFSRQVAKADQTEAVNVLKEAIERLQKQLSAYTGKRRQSATGRMFEPRIAA